MLILWLAPLEKSLGNTIKYVYLHVAFLWCSMAGMVLMALIGICTLFKGSESLAHWRHTIGWATLTTWFLAFAISTIAAKIVWGSVSWSEPLTGVAIKILASLLIVQMVQYIIHSNFIKGLFNIVPMGLLIVLTNNIPRVLHPLDPIKTSESWSIKLTFYSLFLVCLFLSAWFVWVLGRGWKSSR